MGREKGKGTGMGNKQYSTRHELKNSTESLLCEPVCVDLFSAQECPDENPRKSENHPGSANLSVLIPVVDLDAVVPLECFLRPHGAFSTL